MAVDCSCIYKASTAAISARARSSSAVRKQLRKNTNLHSNDNIPYRVFVSRKEWHSEILTKILIITIVIFDIVNLNYGIHVMANRPLSGIVDNEDRRTLLLRNFLRVNQIRRRIKRENAFDLLKLESQMESRDEQTQRKAVEQPIGGSSGGLSGMRRDEALNDEKCQAACNERLRSGLDMVKAHSAFGSVGVPSVVDELDLQMFCRLDSAHDRCLKECGFEIHFNMRDYVCRERFAEMVANLACYERSAAQLKRKCGAQRCGPYSELEVSLLGFAQRCRTLLCDLNCTQSVLVAQCGREPGLRAAKFLIDYSRVQISTWMRDMAKSLEKKITQIIPPSCSRLFCERFDAQNCTSIVDAPTHERKFVAMPHVSTKAVASVVVTSSASIATTTPLSSNLVPAVALPNFSAFGPPSISQQLPPIPPPFPFKTQLSDTVLAEQRKPV